jgi:hypothetical protein
MSTRLFENDGLIQTTIHGSAQNAYVITEEKIEFFNNYSTELQLWLALSSLFIGAFLSNLPMFISNHDDSNILVIVIFYCSLVLSLISVAFLIKSGRKFSKIKSKLFIKIADFKVDTSLKIIDAQYGANGSYVDITSQLSSKIINNTLNIKITNDLAPKDPVPGVAKEAKVKYSFNGEEKEIVVKEKEVLNLP